MQESISKEDLAKKQNIVELSKVNSELNKVQSELNKVQSELNKAQSELNKSQSINERLHKDLVSHNEHINTLKDQIKVSATDKDNGIKLKTCD